MHEVFKRAINPRSRHECLGLRLRPLTLGHLLLLEEWGLGLGESRGRTWGEILLAVFILSRPYQRAKWQVRIPGLATCFGALWGWRCRGRSLHDELKKLAAYFVEEQQLAPIQPPPPGQSRSIGAPWEWVIYDLLRSTYGMSQLEALSTPIRTANALWATRSEMEGRIELALGQPGVASLIHQSWRAAHANSNGQN